MNTLELLPRYLVWHYVFAWGDIFNAFSNILWFLWNFFSIPLLLRTLLSPWRRLGEQHEGFWGNLIVNTIMRFIGAVLRVITIIAGFMSLFVSFVVGIFFLVLWIVLPALAVFLIGFGVMSLLQ